MNLTILVYNIAVAVFLVGCFVGYTYGIMKPERDQKRRAKEKYLRLPKAHRINV